MIRRLSFANLKAFSGKHSVELAPLTLVYGANSAGKSTLLQTLLLLKQTVESSDPERPALVVRGVHADLGSIPGILHNHERTRTLELGLEIDPNPTHAFLPSQGRRGYGFSFQWDSGPQAVRQTAASLALGGASIASYTRRTGPAVVRSTEARGRRDLPFRLGRKAARQQFAEWVVPNAQQREQGRPRLRRHEELFRSEDALMRRLVDEVTVAAAPWGIVPANPAFLVSDRVDDEGGDPEWHSLLRTLESNWRQMSFGFRSELVEALERVVYLGPLRRAPERFQIVSGARRASVGREGEFAAELLSRGPQLTEHVNDALKRLEIPYQVEARHIGEADVSTSLGDVVVLVLTDARSGLQVSPGDVGFGISQLLPIIVQVLAGKRTTVCIEQPEIHVHPKLQAHVAEVFIQAIQPPLRNQLIVETHSEHLMLRLQRHINSGNLDPADVAVLYVDTDMSGAATVVRLRLAEDGTFVDEWPHGFFEERFRELFSGA